ncbi:MAG: LysR family transcriptional regulator [Rhodoferax sp.]|nr:MAG: LysR family transcriptional regulator [Rhodoferax sp.]
MDRFDAMRAFIQVVESGSYTKAAQQLGSHKATLSLLIQQLEAHLQVRLLTRTTRSVSPTEEGQAYYHHSRALLQQLDDAETQVRQGAQTAVGSLRVNVPVAIGRQILAPAVRSFLDRHPGVTLELACSDRSVDLIKEGVDCVLRGGNLPDSGLTALPVGKLHFVLCAAPHYIARFGLPRSPQDILHHTQIGFLLASTNKIRPIQLQKKDETLDLLVPARFVTTDSAAALSAGLDGVGIVVLAGFVADNYLRSGALVEVLPGWRCPPLPLNFVTPTTQHRTQRVKLFMHWARTLLVEKLGTQIEPQ